MRLSSLNSFLSQSQAAALVILCESIMRSAEEAYKRASDPPDEYTRNDASEAQETAYALRCCAEQSIIANDGELMTWLARVKQDKHLMEWIDTEGAIATT